MRKSLHMGILDLLGGNCCRKTSFGATKSCANPALNIDLVIEKRKSAGARRGLVIS
jgi:hypothetical protein